jgi:glucose-6-phosphate isomerase
MRSPVDFTAWQALTRLATVLPDTEPDPTGSAAGDFEQLALRVPGLLVDFSKQPVSAEIIQALLQLASTAGFAAQRERLFGGAPLNVTEGRPALHTALRARPEDRPALAGSVVDQTLQRLRQFANDVRCGQYLGHSGRAISDIVHIGIGGSHLGPELAVEALDGPGNPGIRCHFVANVDGAALQGALARCNPATTLFILVSKSFSTLETQVNASSARSWFLERVADHQALARHFVAITANIEQARTFGIDQANIYPMWDWVGGRFSLWSAVGLPVQLMAGPTAFDELREGARLMDEHFLSAPPARNLPLLMALIGIWNYNFRGVESQAILPYDRRLRLLPDYLQQLEMESNGKGVTLDGHPVATQTMPIVWGGEGTNGQHAFHQLLHQGTRRFAADFIMVANPAHDLDQHHRWLLANGLAQSQAMLLGHQDPDPHRRVPGAKATTTLVLDALTPRSLGSLLALYEHKVFCQGLIWHINSFDQWGVELGKRLAVPIFAQLAGAPAADQDSSTQGLIAHIRACQSPPPGH